MHRTKAPATISIRHGGRTARVLLATAAVAWGVAAPASAAILRVHPDASPGGEGLSWSTAFVSLEAALVAAATTPEADSIWLAEGTYLPETAATPGAPRTRRFAVSDGIAILGGFGGDERSERERDPAAHPTVLSGDFNGDDLPGFVNVGENAYHVVVALGGTWSIDGVTIRGGNANGTVVADRAGGGIAILGGSGSVRATVVESCRAIAGGGGISCGSGSTAVDGCTFRANLHIGEGTVGGGAIQVLASSLVVSDSRFEANQSIAVGTLGNWGGAVFVNGSVSAQFLGCEFVQSVSRQGALGQLGGTTLVADCTFSLNQSVVGGTAGGLHVQDGQTTVDGCLFVDNVSIDDGGAIYATNSTALVRDSEFRGNSAADLGGAISGVAGSLTIERSLFAQNAATIGGGIHYTPGFSGGAGTCRISDCTLEENIAEQRAGALALVFNAAVGGSFLVERSSLRGNLAFVEGGGFASSGTNVPAFPVTFRDSEVVGNWAPLAGALRGTSSSVLFDRCTIVGNSAASVGGLSASIGQWTLRGSILALNEDATGTGAAAQSTLTGAAVLNGSYSLAPLALTGTGNINGLPQFQDADGPDGVLGTEDDDLRAAAASPQINAGDPSFLDRAAIELTGDLRVQGCRVDIGSRESSLLPTVDPDWNGDGVSDACEIFSGTDGDCDLDGVPNAAEIAAGLTDCDANGVPDPCQLVNVPYLAASGNLPAIGTGVPQSYTFVAPPKAMTSVTLSFLARADLSATNEFITVSLNGATLGDIYVTGGADCSTAGVAASLVVPAATFNAASAGGSVTVLMTASAAVSPSQCSGGFISVSISYGSVPVLDQNGNGVIDECEPPEDLTGDGLVDAADLSILLGAWGQCDGCEADLNGDGTVDAVDLAQFLGAWS